MAAVRQIPEDASVAARKRKTTASRKKTASGKERRSRVPSAVRSASILVAFVEESVKRGSIHKVSMRAVAERADCTLAQIYRIFGSRVELIRAAVAWTVGPNTIDLARSRDATSTTRDRLWALGEAVRSRGLGDRAIFNALVVTELQSDRELAGFVKASVERNADMVRQILEEGVENGEFLPDLDCDLIAWRFIGLNTFRIHAYLLGLDVLEELDYEARAFALLVDQICVHPERRKPAPHSEAARPAPPGKKAKARKR